jgi:hypothetical protein
VGVRCHLRHRAGELARLLRRRRARVVVLVCVPTRREEEKVIVIVSGSFSVILNNTFYNLPWVGWEIIKCCLLAITNQKVNFCTALLEKIVNKSNMRMLTSRYQRDL